MFEGSPYPWLMLVVLVVFAPICANCKDNQPDPAERGVAASASAPVLNKRPMTDDALALTANCCELYC
jgi:hypothetical protein